MPDETGFDLYLTDMSPEDKPWDVHRAVAARVEGLYKQSNFNRYAERVARCSLSLGFGLEIQEDGTHRLRLQTAQFCRVRNCPVCGWRRSLMWRARFFQALPRVIEAYPTARWIFLTLTVKNCPLEELRATIGHMNKSWERLSKRKQFPGIGWVKSVEVTRARDDLAHPHFHVLLMVQASYFSHGYLKQSDWTDLWQKSLRVDYLPVVNVKTVKNRRERSSSSPVPSAELNQDLMAGILETLKYSVKPADLVGVQDENEATQQRNAQWLATLTEQLHKTKAISVGGVLKDFVRDEEPEDLIHSDEDDVDLTEDEVKLWFGWREMVKRYAKESK